MLKNIVSSRLDGVSVEVCEIDLEGFGGMNLFSLGSRSCIESIESWPA